MGGWLQLHDHRAHGQVKDAVKRRLLREEKGFSLTEVLVTMLVMVVVLFALYSVFDMSIRVYSFGNDKTEAVENARLGLEKMEREIRGAYPYDLATIPTKTHLFWNSSTPTSKAIPSATLITFGNDLDSDYQVATDTSTEQITYNLSSATCTVTVPCTLRRTVGTGPAQPVVEFVQDVDGDGNALTFKYFTANGTEINPTSPGSYTETDIAMVRIKLEVAVDRGIQKQLVTQSLTTNVALRNRGQ